MVKKKEEKQKKQREKVRKTDEEKKEKKRKECEGWKEVKLENQILLVCTKDKKNTIKTDLTFHMKAAWIEIQRVKMLYHNYFQKKRNAKKK